MRRLEAEVTVEHSGVQRRILSSQCFTTSSKETNTPVRGTQDMSTEEVAR